MTNRSKLERQLELHSAEGRAFSVIYIEHLPQEGIAGLLDSRLHGQQSLNPGSPYAGDNFLRKCFPIGGGLPQESQHPANRVKQRISRRRDQRDSQRSSHDDPRGGGLKKVAEVHSGRGYPSDDRRYRDRNPGQDPSIRWSSRRRPIDVISEVCTGS